MRRGEGDVVDRVRDFVREHGLWDGGDRVVAGVSGGVDSMVLLHVLVRLGVEVTVVHVDYGLREASAEDARFVLQACDALGVDGRVVERDPKTSGASVQAVARRQRYAAFAHVARDVGARVVATGHHRDDQAETVLLNLVRGAGPEGLAGMAPSRRLSGETDGASTDLRLVRPLLHEARATLEAFARKEGIDWREDVSNASNDYRRNVIRNEILPRLESMHSGATANVARGARLVRDYVDETLDPALERHWDRAVVKEDETDALALQAEVLQSVSSVWRRRLVLEALYRVIPDAPQTYAVAEDVAALLDRQVGRRVEVGGGTVWRERGQLRFVPAQPDESDDETVLMVGDSVAVPGGGRLSMRALAHVPSDLDAGADVVFLDADACETPLRVRRWRDGDRMQPLGMRGTKLVADVLTDAKVPPHRRRDAWTVVDAGGRVVWLRGEDVSRIDHRVRVRPETTQVLRLEVGRGFSFT